MPDIVSPKVPLYVALAEQLRAQIQAGALHAGDRLPSFAEMRAEHGVTAATVNRIYAHLEKDGLVTREQGRGTFVANREARVLTGFIGINGSWKMRPVHPYVAHLLAGFREVAENAGFELVLLNGDVDIDSRKIDGLIVCELKVVDRQHHVIDREWTQRELFPSIPCVSALVNMRGVASVVADEYQGAYDLTSYLLSQGHRRIAAMYDPFSPARLVGYRNALRDAGIEAPPKWGREVCFKNFDVYGNSTYMQLGYELMQQWLQEDWQSMGCTALVAQNDDAAIGAMRALGEAGLCVPDDVSVAGFDGTEIGRYFQPQITSVEMPLHQIAATAMELLIRQIRGEDVPASKIVLPAPVLPGASTKASKS